jgi:isopentenyl diphosphate isomerase/L-lactate dehydrogenase-like FMN-dependent dehydrogenase
MLSTVATTSIEDAIAARGRPVFFQLYPTDKWDVAEALAKRAEKAGAGAIVVTVDTLARQNWETLYRLMRQDTRDCSACHQRTIQSYVQRKPNFDGIDMAGVVTTNHSTLTWEFVKRLRGTVKSRLLVKGLMTAEDARLAADNGLDGIVVSNHGGRVDDSGRSTIDAMGARAVAIGRPYLWGLGAFGQPGVERVLGLLQTELRAVMMQMGAPSLKDLTPALVRRAD